MKAFATARSQGTSRGISLLEVMISIGVVGIGLLGVASLIPLANYKATKGVQEDRKALFGKRAFREYYVQNIRQRIAVPPTYDAVSRTNFEAIRTAYVIDPVLMGQINQPVAKFPYDTRLANSPVGNLLPLRLTIDAAALPLAKQAIADQIFRMSDDLVIEAPKTPQEFMRQSYVFSVEPSNPPRVNPASIKTYSYGTYSWMATISPDSLNRPASRTQMLSIVVFHQRQLTLPRQEIFYSITGDLSGPAKVVYLQESQQQTLPVPGDSSDVGPRAGGWIAVVRLVPGNPTGVSELKWYRIVSADTVEQSTGGNIIRELTLTGPDWVATPTGPPGGVFAVYVKNVASVYEKTIEMD